MRKGRWKAEEGGREGGMTEIALEEHRDIRSRKSTLLVRHQVVHLYVM